MFNERAAYDRKGDIYDACAGYSSEYLIEIITAYADKNGITRPVFTAEDVARKILVDMVYRMVFVTAMSDEAGTVFWLVRDTNYIIELNARTDG